MSFLLGQDQMLKPYLANKESEVPWLGKVPVHWDVLPNRALFTEVKERNHPDEQMLSVTITRGVIPQSTLLADSSKKDGSNDDRSAYKLVRPGDIAYNKMRAWQGAIGVSDHLGIISPAYVVQRPRAGAHPRYFHYLLRTPAFAKEAERWSYGITSDMWSLRPEHFKMIYGCLPPPSEQAAIVRFLDYIDRRIRKYIRAKQKLIKLLEEQKQAIIHRAVTRGLDPNVRLKPSGVEWLRDIPEHWEVRRLKSLARIAGRIGFRGYTTEDLVEPGEGAIALGATHIRSTGQLDLSAPVFISWDKYYESPEIMVKQGDILVVQRGSTSGKIGYIRNEIGKATINPSLILVSDVKCYAEFIFLALMCSTTRSYFSALLSSTAIPMLSQYQVGNAPLVLPSIEEQYAIVGAVKEQTQNVQIAIEQATTEIQLTLEYRTRLIADVVTGKLDAREAAPRFPAKADESEQIDDTGEPTENGTDDPVEEVVDVE